MSQIAVNKSQLGKIPKGFTKPIISKAKAVDIASEWHGGQRSALYQFSSSGIYLKDRFSEYLNEISENKKTAKGKQLSNLNSLYDFFRFKNSENQESLKGFSAVNKPKSNKLVWWLAGTTGLAIAGGLLWKLKSFSDKLDISIDSQFKVTGRGLFDVPTKFQLIITPKLKNNSNTSITITQPLIEIRVKPDSPAPFVKGGGGSKEFQIKKLDTTTLDPLPFDMTLATMVKAFASIITDSIKNKSLKLYITTSSFMVIQGKKIAIPPSTKEEVFKL